MKLKQLHSADDVQAIYTPDKPTHSLDFDSDIGLFRPMACTTPLFIKRDKGLIIATEWFITKQHNELIYDIEKNNWVNLDLFEAGDSYCNGLFTLDLENEADSVNIIAPISLSIPSFVAQWHDALEQHDVSDEDVFDWIMASSWQVESINDDYTHVVPLDIRTFLTNRDHRLAVLRILSGERYDVID